MTKEEEQQEKARQELRERGYSEESINNVMHGIQQAKEGKFAKNPPNLDDLKPLKD